MALALLFAIPLTPNQQSREKQIHIIPTSDVVKVAWMAARDEGYDPNAVGTFLDELRVKGTEPIEGYTSIGLYVNVQLTRSYSIRLTTGDVVDATSCTLFRYPDLIKYKKELMRGFGTQEVSDEQIAKEVGCDKLDVLPAKSSGSRQK